MRRSRTKRKGIKEKKQKKIKKKKPSLAKLNNRKR